MISFKNILPARIKHDKTRFEGGYILASTAIIIFIAIASMAVVLQYAASISSSTRTSAQSVGAANAAASGLSAAASCLNSNPSLLDIESAITPSSPCVDGAASTGSILGTSLSHDNTFRVTGESHESGLTITSVGESRLGSHSYSSNLKANLPVGPAHFVAKQHTLVSHDATPPEHQSIDTQVLSAGARHTCYFVHGDGLYCWGDGGYGRLGNGNTSDSSSSVPVKVGGALADKVITSVGAGDEHTCASTSEGEVYCWGRNRYGQSAQSSTGQFYRSPGRVMGALASRNVTQVNVGANHSCAVTDNGEVYCWGYNASGQLGNGSKVNSTSPVRVNIPNGNTISKVSGGYYHTCAVATNGSAFCWGENGYFQLGASTTSIDWQDRPNPSQVRLSGRLVSDIATGKDHSCAVIRGSGDVYCWGKDRYGRLGNGRSSILGWERVPTKARNITNVQQIDAGYYHTCAVDNRDDTWCWGRGGSGRLGFNSTSNSTSPKRITHTIGSLKIATVSAGDEHSCAATDTGQVYCFGNNSNGRIGDGTTTTRLVPVGVNSLPAFNLAGGRINSIPINKSVSAGQVSACGIDIENKLYCWGRNEFLQLGHGGAELSVPTPQRVVDDLFGDREIRDIAAGSRNTCAMMADGESFCWGDNTVGQLGNGTYSNSPVPVPIVSPSEHSFKSISSYHMHSCAVDEINDLYCWGNNGNGQLGRGNNSNVIDNAVPARPNNHATLKSQGGIAKVATGSWHTCALTYSGNIFCWGTNGSGQLGNGNTISHYDPRPIDTSGVPVADRTFVDVSANSSSTCAVTSTGKAYCWGGNEFGKLGNRVNNTGNMPRPVQVQTDYIFTGVISAGEWHTCAVATHPTNNSNSVICWGDNSVGQLGVGTVSGPVFDPTPIPELSSGLPGTHPDDYRKVTSVSSGRLFSCAVVESGETFCWGMGADGRLGNGDTVDQRSPVRVKMDNNLGAAQWVY